MTEKREPTAITTERPSNQFKDKIYVRVYEDGTIRPLDRKFRKSSTHVIELVIEYIPYEDELAIKRSAVRFDEKNHVHYTDYDHVTEERIRRCLSEWNLHEIFPKGMFPKLFRVRRLLEDDSIGAWKKLPPLLRKAIAFSVNSALGVA